MTCHTKQIKTHVGGNIPTIEFALKTPVEVSPGIFRNDPVDITGKTVKFLIYRKLTGQTRSLLSDNVATITDGINGEGEITLLPSDVDTAAVMSGYVSVNHGGSNNEIFPAGGSIQIIVSAL